MSLPAAGKAYAQFLPAREHTLGTATNQLGLAIGGVGAALLAGWLTPAHGWQSNFLIAGPLGFVAIESGWVVTEVGRQPWIIYGVMRTEAAVTPMPGLGIPFVAFTVLYVFLAFVVVLVLRRQFLGPSASISAPPTT